MPFGSSSSRGWVRRVLLGGLLVQVGAIVSLMATTSIRKRLRAKGTPPLPRVPAEHFPIGGGNEVQVYVSGEVLYDDMLAAIAGARRRILLESYIIKADAMGRRFRQALRDAADRGVEVCVIYDGFANLVVPPRFFRFGHGIKMMRYPILPRRLNVFSPRSWGRDHRKILVVDDAIGFVGGYNIGSLYANEWRDTHVALTGPAVWDLENAVIDFWNDSLFRTKIRALTEATWDPHVRAHRNVPRQLIFPIRGMYLEAIDRAVSTIEITQAYFIPDQDILQALIDASRRGVHVRILVPKVSNHVVADFIARSYFGPMLEAGIEILRYRDHMVHAKTMTIDGEWSTIGTANIDRLSLTGNYEINLEILDEKLARGMSRIFERDAQKAEVLDVATWRSRPTIARLYERLLRPWRPLV
ncbi:phosphatidylserine/phosphatidylglycerophosphate/cardiolipin synthase family protein [Aeromicrobium sp. 636]|uniref:Phosphatidylserine/phosphatidylglycerophosphate/ cardiolipin synthase family protein n=1 Tax=Aeromicrobium senzhongii TaxID=2663859 RepID=A0A8I0ETC5_9ACTN|nr:MULTISPECIES: phospholipase D-like domain-containing protein [Aeromicrobium]MBC9224762.1 phosphatidylserine/phosphatidylglycerophosphate/cardiolipin synthase family protein [Aeromicrobium senzhongii]MCQ3996875.1 phosphatidylserine/phosphatidylglycerophosphate/cardiolipin synthase family protein [Aeromicrobium sp. 636]MTB86808.1 phosphatidylserine/phosphatidylglycerophosphate/cardiolipin synthase family protein [Aeromicrobium senzhongii]QNL93352.1 phosphatidylserine/phosphatidylglycerophospha